MALVPGIIGIYWVIYYAVSQRTREIGIRLALGAQKSQLWWLFVRSGFVLTGAGVAVTLVVAAALMRFMKSMLFGTSPLDPFTYISISLILAAAAVLASYLPLIARQRWIRWRLYALSNTTQMGPSQQSENG